VSQPDLTEAIRFAAHRHAGQHRDGPVPLPYVTHPIEVLLHVRHTAGVTDQEMLCASVLHDVVEECGVQWTTLQRRFGPGVTDLVRELTRDEPDEEIRRTLSKAELVELRSRLLLEGIARMSDRAQVIKLADRLANVIDSKRTRTGTKRERYIAQTRQITTLIPRERCPALWDAIDREVAGEP